MKLQDGIKVGKFNIQNRVVFQPMEACDCNLDGSPSELTEKKYFQAVESGAGLIWFEANAVVQEGKTNLRQMSLTKENAERFRSLVSRMKEQGLKQNGYAPIMILQLTHSGRQSLTPMIMYRNEVYERKRPVTDMNIVSDEYLDALPEKYAESARLAEQVGFDGVDVKSCHGYLLQESLSAFNRSGKYGGSFENRTKLFLNCVKAVKQAVSEDYFVTSRLGITDMVEKPCGFGTDENNNIDLTEPKKLITLLNEQGINLINITIGNPYFNPYVNRPYRKGLFEAPESPEVSLERFEWVEKEIKKAFPEIIFIGSGLSYYRENLIEKSNEQIENGVCDMVGYGRVSIAYPQFYKDYLAGKFNPNKCCVSCSKCTMLMRHGEVSGCAVFNEYYRNLFKEKIN